MPASGAGGSLSYLMGESMSENKDAISEEEAVQENIFQVHALIALLEQKGILTREEVMNEVQGLKNRG